MFKINTVMMDQLNLLEQQSCREYYDMSSVKILDDYLKFEKYYIRNSGWES